MMRKDEKNAKTISRKTLAIALSMVLVLGAAVGGTIAWLISSTEPVKNVFTPSNIKVELAETNNPYKMIPGWTIAKDPKVTVKQGSEDCWLFIKVEKTGGVTIGEGQAAKTYSFDDFIAYDIDTDWTAGTGTGTGGNGIPIGVYYRKVENLVSADKEFKVLVAGSFTDNKLNPAVTVTWKDNEVATKPSVTEEMMEALNKEGAVKPTLSFTAYASQLYKTNKPVKATGQTDADYASAVAAAQFTAAEAWANIK